MSTPGRDRFRAVAVLCVRDEGAFLLDWLAHHLATGFTHVVACSNACSDGTDALLDRLESLGFVTHLRNPPPYGNAGIQFTGLKRAAKTEAVQAADWLFPLDIDEFVNIRVGAHRLDDLWDALPDATAITLTWRLFGNNGVVAWEDRPLWEVFTKAAPEIVHWPWRAAMFKTFYRNDGIYGALGVHRPRNPRGNRLAQSVWRDGAGRLLPPRFKTKGVFSPYGRDNTTLVQLNHYPLGAMESFVLKAARGRAVHADQPLGLDYWVERNFAEVEDRSMEALARPRAEIRADLGADPILAKLHDAAVDWRHKKFAELMDDDTARDLMGRLMMTSLSKTLTRAQTQSLLSHTKTRSTPGRNVAIRSAAEAAPLWP